VLQAMALLQPIYILSITYDYTGRETMLQSTSVPAASIVVRLIDLIEKQRIKEQRRVHKLGP